MKITKRQLRRIIKEYEFPGSKPHPGRDEVRGYDMCPPGYEAYFDNTVSKTVCRPVQDSGASQSAQIQSPDRHVEVQWDLEDTEFEDMPYDQGIRAAGLPAVVELPDGMDEYELNDWLSDEYGFTHHGWEPIEENRVRITKGQLKQIIKEEKAKLLKEAPYQGPRFASSDAQEWGKMSGQDLYVNLTDEQQVALDDLERAVDKCMAAGVTDADMKDTIESRTMS
jgi:hypothetical protein